MNLINQSIINVITSTGLIARNDSKLYIFCDKHTGFVNYRRKCEYFNNIHFDIKKENNIELYHFFYYYPLHIEQISLFTFFKRVITNWKEAYHKYNSFIWKIGKMQSLYDSNEYILKEMRKIHGSKFIPQES